MKIKNENNFEQILSWKSCHNANIFKCSKSRHFHYTKPFLQEKLRHILDKLYYLKYHMANVI